ncbi:MAG: arginine--tRNA ligase, partial [Pseudomonadota bacterium]
MHVKALLAESIEAAFTRLGLTGDALVQVAARPEYGDYQANGIMAAAKRAGRNPREVAAEVLAELDLKGVAHNLEIAGPGFINITLAPEFLATVQPGEVLASSAPKTIVVDYSAPNLAKEMHVGHLRGTSIGDCLVRVLEAQGHTVLRQNHVGDWGTQFGMLITYLRESGEQSDELQDLERFYVSAKQRFDDDPAFQDAARQAVVDLQGGDPATLAEWQRFIDISLSHCQAIYDRLGITLRSEHTQGESAYNAMLPDVIETLRAQGLLQNSDGAQCVFLEQFKNKKGDIQPIIVQKSDGGYLYATTDLAAVQYRTDDLQAERALYLTDARQALHFQQIFALSAAAGFNRNGASLEHMAHGSVLGLDGQLDHTAVAGFIRLA